MAKKNKKNKRKTTVVPTASQEEVAGSHAMAPQGFDGFLSSLNDHYNAGAFSDVVVVCKGQEFMAHRIILSAHSKYLAKELNGDWKGSFEKKITIDEFDVTAVEAMLRFMYSFDYTNICGSPSMVCDAQVYQIADKYDIPALKAHSKGRFGTAVATGWSMDCFTQAITLVYGSAPSEDRGLRDLAVAAAQKNIDQLLGNSEFWELLKKIPDFSADLIPLLRGKNSANVPQYRCPSCSNTFGGEFSGRTYYCPLCAIQRSDWESHLIEK